MNVISVSVRTFRSATTNPPINESRELTLTKTGMLTCEEMFNGASNTNHYFVSPQQINGVFALFEELQIAQLAIDILSQPPAPPVMQQVGGMSGTVISFVANGVSVSFASSDERVLRLGAELNKILAACGEAF